MENLTIKRPAIEVVLVDDRGYSDVQLFGSEARMPHPESFADNGIRFRHVHAGDESPVC